MNVVSAKTAEYELVLMLDPEVPDERRDQIASDALKRIEAAGSLKHDRAWGMRKLAYEIHQRTEADYRFFRFEGESSLLEGLDHNLKITDGVLRFRIFRVDSDTPVIEPPPPVALASSAPSRGPGAGRRPAGEQSREDAPAGEASPAAGAPEEADAEAAPATDQSVPPEGAADPGAPPATQAAEDQPPTQ